VQLQAVSAPAPDPNATAAPAGSGTSSGGSSLPATAGDSADDLSAYLNQQASQSNQLQPFPFKIDGRHMLILAAFALGAIVIFARRRRAAR
jgi:hypothetical protein